MFGEISLLTWIIGAIVFAVGGSAGFFTARQIKDKRTLELEQQLEATQNKLTEYQSDVNRHFLKTSLLFNKLTDNYREVYEHLATGAQKLCNDKPLNTALDLPEAKILSAATSVAATSDANTENLPSETSAEENLASTTTSATTTATHSTEPQNNAEQHSDHLGVEAIGATEAVEAANAAPESIDDAATPKADETEQAATTAATEEETSAHASDDTPDISKEELKALEASEQKKQEEEDIHLGAESTPGVELEHHKTHPSIH